MKTNYEKLMKINYEKLLIFYLPFTNGNYWSSSLNTDNPNNAWNFNFNSDNYGMNNNNRNYGQSSALCALRVSTCLKHPFFA